MTWKHLKNSLNALAAWKWTCFVLYFLAMPVYAWLYAHHSGDFYESNAVLELHAVTLSREIEADLKQVASQVYLTAPHHEGVDEFSGLAVTWLKCDDHAEVSFVTPFHRSAPKSFGWRRDEPVWHLEVPPLRPGEMLTGSALTIEKLPIIVALALKNGSSPTPGGGFTVGPMKHVKLEPADPENHLVGDGRMDYGKASGQLWIVTSCTKSWRVINRSVSDYPPR
jgi:hypothetical protein